MSGDRPGVMFVCAGIVLAVLLGTQASCASNHRPPGESRGSTELPSWHDGPARRAILEFVRRTTTHGSADFVPAAERIAVFDNDGTLWTEHPVPIQLAFALDSLRECVQERPELRSDPMVEAALNNDFSALLAGDRHEGLLRVIALTHAGYTTDEFRDRVNRWMDVARHPRFGTPYDRVTYAPMLELIRLLQGAGYKAYIVTGGGADFVRAVSERLYGIPPEQVVGTSTRTRFEWRDGTPVLVKTTEHLFVNDKEGKPVAIHQFIGRRPIACFGNSDGDKAMLEYTTVGNPLPSLGLLVHHTDEVREYAYDTVSTSSGRLAEALREAPGRGWAVVDMKIEWREVFGEGDRHPSHRRMPPARAQEKGHAGDARP